MTKKLRIGLFVDNKNVSEVDFSRPELGNPGTGAAEYLPVALAYAFCRYFPEELEPIVFSTANLSGPKDIEVIVSENLLASMTAAKKMSVDYFVYRPRQREESGATERIDFLGLNALGRAALSPSSEHNRTLARSSHVRALVCVGREQFDSLCDTPLRSKLVMIENGIFSEQFTEHRGTTTRDPHLVTYLGALTPQKGFHVLAEAWPQVLKRCPYAKLNVIGSSKAYDQNAATGDWGVAAPSYENTWKHHLAMSSGAPHPSVNFLGLMGTNKASILAQSAVGIANPTGATETSCVAAIEFQVAGTPVVSGAYHALLDTVRHGQTGLLGRTVTDLAENIVTLLEQPSYARRLGDAAQEYATARYDFKVVSAKWNALFRHLEANSFPPKLPPPTNLFRHMKYLRMLNSLPQRTLGNFVWWPSVTEVADAIKKLRSQTKR